ncbi:MAG: DNA repair exonuclease [Verrucomicrobia bacterium]|nr:DNA repair exonuclease [Verrucomicrobiota bacterium]
MNLRILHTADNHIGISFNQYPEVRERLVEERFEALERLVATGNEREAHFFVVAGDLFDKQSVTKGQVERAVKILAGFEGEAVLVLAGNHDFCEGADNKLWKWVRAAAEGTTVLALTEAGTREFAGDDYKVRFYACPCPSKHGREHMIGWVEEEEKGPDFLHVGLAHGNVEGLGLDADQRYFNMSEGDLRAAGVDTWLLGHIHVPAPAPGTTGKPLYFMPGIHTPDSVKCSHPGHAWWIEFEKGGKCRHEQLTAGAIRFARVSKVLEHAGDLAALRTACEAFDAPKTILDLQLTGRLREEELEELNEMLGELAPGFLHFTREQDIAPVLDAAAIAKRYPEGTLPSSLLLALLQDDAHPGDAHLALDIIESIRPS